MHIPDGVIDLWLLISLWVVVIIAWAAAIVKSRKTLSEEESKLPLLAIMTAMVFALQLLNFPIIAGTSGHLLGFVLIAILLSPSQAILSISTVLIIQALVFGDGGLVALSANIFNMAIVPLVGYFLYYAIRKFKESDKGLIIATFVGAYASVILASLVAGVELGVSSLFPYPIEVTVPSILFWHIFIALGEAAITTAIIIYIQKNRSDLIPKLTDLKLWW
ncbi:MAG: energy-coupling factor ABC transporter permease [Candidatus Helarchaeota archaeon]|nr:energy-coupling factor ABC transporter permease [Candidatus Helarchaeota archaeon]